MRKPKRFSADAAGPKGGRTATVAVSEAAPNTVASDAIRDLIPPPTREQLMPGSANLRRAYKLGVDPCFEAKP